MFLIYTEEIISLGFCLLYVSGFPLADGEKTPSCSLELYKNKTSQSTTFSSSLI